MNQAQDDPTAGTVGGEVARAIQAIHNLTNFEVAADKLTKEQIAVFTKDLSAVAETLADYIGADARHRAEDMSNYRQLLDHVAKLNSAPALDRIMKVLLAVDSEALARYKDILGSLTARLDQLEAKGLDTAAKSNVEAQGYYRQLQARLDAIRTESTVDKNKLMAILAVEREANAQHRAAEHERHSQLLERIETNRTDAMLDRDRVIQSLELELATNEKHRAALNAFYNELRNTIHGNQQINIIGLNRIVALVAQEQKTNADEHAEAAKRVGDLQLRLETHRSEMALSLNKIFKLVALERESAEIYRSKVDGRDSAVRDQINGLLDQIATLDSGNRLGWAAIGTRVQEITEAAETQSNARYDLLNERLDGYEVQVAAERTAREEARKLEDQRWSEHKVSEQRLYDRLDEDRSAVATQYSTMGRMMDENQASARAAMQELVTIIASDRAQAERVHERQEAARKQSIEDYNHLLDRLDAIEESVNRDLWDHIKMALERFWRFVKGH